MRCQDVCSFSGEMHEDVAETESKEVILSFHLKADHRSWIILIKCHLLINRTMSDLTRYQLENKR